MYLELLPENRKSYKVNMHCHTDISDGKQTPQEVKELYQSKGYSAVCFTDHEILIGHEDLCDDDFIALHGYEIAIKKDQTRHTSYFMPVYHFNFIARSQKNLTMPLFYKNNPSRPGNSRKWIESSAIYEETIDKVEYDTDWINEYLEGVSKAGFLVNYNHPQWSLQTREDFIDLKNIHSLELINGGCIALNDNTSISYDQMLRAGMRLVPTGGDDNHASTAAGNGWTMIKASELTYDALISAYEKGHCYASEGPDIYSIVLCDGKIKVKTSPASFIVLMSEGRYTESLRSRTATYTEAEFEYVPEKMGKYFRIEVRDEHGYKAYSNAYFIDDIEKKLS